MPPTSESKGHCQCPYIIHHTFNTQSIAKFSFQQFFPLQEGKTCIKSMNILTIIHVFIKYCYIGEVSYCRTAYIEHIVKYHTHILPNAYKP